MQLYAQKPGCRDPDVSIPASESDIGQRIGGTQISKR
jgi:hypothetical protein